MRMDPNYVQQLTTALSQSGAQQQRIASEISSGLRLSGIGDDPAAAAQNVQLNARLVADSSFSQTVTTTESRLQATDSTLSAVVDQITRAISLATSGNNGTNTVANQQSIAQELSGVRDEILGLANTSYAGTYLFSGSNNSVSPFQLDTSSTPATVTYNGDARVNTISTPGGQSIGVNLPGTQVFSAAGADLFGTLNQLIQGFATGDTATTTPLASQLSVVLTQVSSQRASLDNSITRLQSASTYASEERTRLTANQTNLLEADLPTVANQLSTSETQQSALESVIVSLDKQGSLFDRL